MNKKISVLIAAILTLSTMLSGCGSSKTKVTTSENYKPYQLDWYVVGSGTQADMSKVEEQADKLVSDLNVQLKMHIFSWGDYNSKIQTMIAANEKIDLLYTCTWAANIFDYVRKGVLIDITTLAPKYAPDAVAALKNGFWEFNRIGGKSYSLSTNKEKAAQMGYEFNKNLVDKYKFDITKVKSVDDLDPMLKTVKQNEPTIYPIEAGGGLVGLGTMNDEKLASDLVTLPHDSTSNNFVLSVDNPNYIYMLNKARAYYNLGYIRKDSATITDVTADRKAGKNFAMFDSLKPGKDAEVSSSSGVPVVQQNIGTPFIRTYDMIGGMGIPKTCKDPNRVLMFYNRMYSDPKLTNLIDFGIEDTHYVVKSPGIIDFAPATDSGKKSGYNPGTPWMYGDQFKSYLFTNEDPQKWVKFKDFNDSAVKLKDTGFVFDDESVKNEIATCVNVQKEFDATLNSGTVDPTTTLPKYKAKLIVAGANKILDEVNKQYKAWQSTQK